MSEEIEDVFLVLDIGSTKLCALVAKTIEKRKINETIDNELEEKSLSDIDKNIEILCNVEIETPLKGVQKGSIVGIEDTAKAIKQLLNEIKRLTGFNMTSAIISIPNSYTKRVSSVGVVSIPNEEIGMKYINRLTTITQNNAKISDKYQIIHSFPQYFKVNDENIRDPFGMMANRLEMGMTSIVTEKSKIQNITKAVISSGVSIDDIVLSGYASAIATIDSEDKDLGVCVIDMGGQTSDLVIYSNNSIQYNSFLPIGSDNITKDISITFETTSEFANNFKINFKGFNEEDLSEVVEVPIRGSNEDEVTRVEIKDMHKIISNRVEETFQFLNSSLENSHLKQDTQAGVVLTGGMAKLKGVKDFAKTFFELPVRIGYPKLTNGVLKDELNDPTFSTSIGLIKYKLGEHIEYEINSKGDLLNSKNIVKAIKVVRGKESSNSKEEDVDNGLGGDMEDINIKLPEHKKPKGVPSKIIEWIKIKL